MPEKFDIESLRAVEGLPLREAAQILGVHHSTIAKWRERTVATPGAEDAPKTLEFEGKVPKTKEEVDAALRQRGIDPDKHNLSFKWGAWGKDGSTSESLRISAVPIRETPADADVEILPSIIESIQQWTPAEREPQMNRSATTLVVCIADLQIGKTDWNGGTAETVAQVAASMDRATELASYIRYDEILLIDAGDIIENIYNTSSQLGTNDRDLPHQVEIASHVVLESIKRLAPFTDSLKYLAIPSNHGAQRLGKGSPAGDVHADYGIVIANMLSAALTLNPEAFGHVQVVTPERGHEGLYVASSGSDIGVVHGHQVNNPDGLGKWWAGQSHGNMPVGKARILITGHWHSLRVQQSGDGRWIIVCPSSDRGSSWFTNKTGEQSDSGVLLFETYDNKWTNLEIA